jgi:PadR family transcriptional regulator, regulatory protein AphA
VPRRLNNTGVVVLGLVAAGRRNGYEIVRTIERSTAHFWGASPGGIYPELRRLEQDGYLRSVEDPRGGAARHSVTITPAGRAALRAWLESDEPGVLETRNEDLLRLFLAADLDTEAQLRILRRIRAAHEERVRTLETITRPAAEADPAPCRTLVLEYGLALHGAAARWCAEAEARLKDHH